MVAVHFLMTSRTCWAQGTQKLQPHPVVCHHPQQCVTTPVRFYRFGRPSLLEIRRNLANFKVFHLFAFLTSLFVKQSRPILSDSNDGSVGFAAFAVGFVHRCFFRWREPILCAEKANNNLFIGLSSFGLSATYNLAVDNKKRE